MFFFVAKFHRHQRLCHSVLRKHQNLFLPFKILIKSFLYSNRNVIANTLLVVCDLVRLNCLHYLIFLQEPATNFALVKHPKVVACPHLGASTKEGQARCGKEVAEQLVDVKKGTSFFGVVSMSKN